MLKPSAIIIEDDRDTVALFRHVLDFAGYKTEIILRGEKAIERLSLSKPDVILLDLNLPGLPGSEVLNFIHTQDHLANSSVIVITAHAHMAMGLQSETDLILLKPVSVEQLTNLILRLRPVGEDNVVVSPRDALTGLYSRAFFVSRLAYSIERTRQLDGGVFAVLYVDYDSFKPLCDQNTEEFTHALIIETAKFFRSIIRTIDTISRFEHDHFLIQIEDLTSKEIPLKIAERIQAKLPEHIKAKFGIDLTASIGIVNCGTDYLWAEEIIRDADIALYLAKQKGRPNLETFNPVKHEAYRDPDEFAKIRRIGLTQGDPTKPREFPDSKL